MSKWPSDSEKEMQNSSGSEKWHFLSILRQVWRFCCFNDIFLFPQMLVETYCMSLTERDLHITVHPRCSGQCRQVKEAQDAIVVDEHGRRHIEQVGFFGYFFNWGFCLIVVDQFGLTTKFFSTGFGQLRLCLRPIMTWRWRRPPPPLWWWLRQRG